VLGQARSSQRYVPLLPDDEEALTRDIVRLAGAYGRYGYRRITAMVNANGWRVLPSALSREMFPLSIMVTVLVLAFAAPASAGDTCAHRIDYVVNEWNAIMAPTAEMDSNPDVKRAHEHTAGEDSYMRWQMRMALRLCNEGQEHESMLRLDVVRAWLKLPEVQHPHNHRYEYDRRTR
jgi:hypothetical protein